MNDGSRPAMILPTTDKDRQHLSIRYKICYHKRFPIGRNLDEFSSSSLDIYQNHATTINSNFLHTTS